MHGVLVLAIFGFCLLLAQFVAARKAVAGGADGDRRRGLARDALSGREHRVRRPDPRRGALGARRPADRAPAACPRRGGACSCSLPPARRPRPRWRRTACSPGSAGTRTADVPAAFRSATSGTPTTAGSSFRRRRRPSCASSGRSAASTGARRRSTSSPPIAGSRTRRRSRPAWRRGRLPSDPLLPTRSLNRRTWIKQQVEVRRAPRRAHRRRDAAGRSGGAAARRCLQPLRRDRPRLRRAQARAALHRLQLRAAPGAGPARPHRARLPARARPLPPDRAHAGGAVRRRRPRRARRRALRRRALPRPLALREPLERGTAASGGRADALRGGRRDRDLASRDRRLRLRRVAAADRRPAAARALRGRGQARLLPALRRRDGPDAPLPRDSRACRRGVHERQARGRRLDRHRPQRACLGGGLVPGLRLARLRPDTRPRRSRRHLQRVVDRLQRR